MNPFEMVIAIVAIACFAGIVKTAIYARQRNHEQDEELVDVADQLERKFARRLDKLEQRLANVETLVLEKERLSKFDDL